MAIGTLAWCGTVKSTTTYTYKPTITEIKSRPIQQNYSTEFLKDFVGEVAIKYGLSAELYQEMMVTIQCESNWDESVFSKGKISYGISQFTRDTFKGNCKGNYYNPLDQLECMAKMYSQKMYHRWDCFKVLFPNK